jgi:hypothetical protein
VLAVALAPALAAACFSPRLRVASAVLGIGIVAAVALNERTGIFKIRSAPTKGLYQHLAATPGARIVLTGWNAYSRIDAVTGFPSPYLARLYIDSDAWTNVLEWDGRLESVASFRDWYRALPFQVVPENPKTLVIGPGGGSDVLVALAAGSETVTAAEMNPLMLQFVRHFGAGAGHLYDHPKVEAILTEGRTFIRRTDRLFDVILLGFVDSWAAVASGGLSLSENHLYTTEAFRAYYDHLTPDGALVILRWDVDIPRLVSNAIAVLGREEAGKRVAVLLEKRRTTRDPAQMIFMLKRRPFTEDETALMMDWTLAVPLIVPDRHVDEPYASVFDGRMSVAEWESTAPTRVDPVTDDRPFFFARQKPWGLPMSMRREFVRIVLPLLALCILLVALGRPRGERAGPYLASVLYFSCLGVGFIAVELGLLQQLTLLLGHPIFTLSILLFTLLASGGLGSYCSVRYRPGKACLAAAGLGVVYAVVLPRAVPALLPLPLVGRIALAILLVAPLGFVMGIPFPRGLMSVGRGPFPGAPFYWGLNGIFSVVGSLATMVAAVTLGFQVAMVAGALLYVGAAASATVFETPRAVREAAAA